MEDHTDLLRAAYLLTGSDGGARDLLVRGLVRGGGIKGLVRAHLRRGLTRDAVLTGSSGDPWWLSAADVTTARCTAGALDGLPRAERTAVVLRWHEGLTPDRVAALVPGVDTSTLPARLGVPAAELPGRLEGLAALADLRDLTDPDLDRAVRELRTRRRTRALLAVGAVAVLAAGALWLPGALPAPQTAGQTAATATPAGPVASASGAPRGSLADDAAFVAGLRAQLDPGPDDGRLLYAGDTAGLRWALVVRAYGDGVTTFWFVGPEGAAPADLDQVSGITSADGPAAWSLMARTGDRSALLVVGDPGDGVQVSDGFVTAADGSAGRTFTAVEVVDGVAGVPLTGGRTADGVVYRLVRDGSPVATESPSALVLVADG